MDWKPEKDTDSGKIVSKYGLTQSGLRSLFFFYLCFQEAPSQWFSCFNVKPKIKFLSHVT